MLTWAKKQVLSRFIFLGLLFTLDAIASDLRISTFNIRWYGLQDDTSLLDQDERDRHVRETVDAELSSSDVIVFEEIVDVSRFRRNIIRGKMRCVSYTANSSKHQHVVLCHKEKYRFEKVSGDNNYTIEEVVEGTTKGRPAVYGLLTTSGGTPLAYVVGVHLKAFPEETALRLKQTHAIAKRLKELRKRADVPILITGDFNTHVRENTQWSKDDHILMDEIFRKYDLSLYEVRNPFPFTYRSTYGESKFDRLWVSRGVTTKGKVRVSDLCAEETMSESQIEWYNEFVSDHCLVSFSLSLGR